MTIDQLPSADWQRIHRTAVEFERSLAAGAAPDIEDILRGVGALRGALLPELVHAEFEFRRRRGDLVRADEYRARFDELGEETIGELRALEARITRDTPIGIAETLPTATASPTPNIVGYHILEKIGQGGMGVVYRAKDERLGRIVALKMLPTGGDADRAVRLRREAEAGARLQHPGIVQVFEVGAIGDQVYLAQEFVPGGTLHQALALGPLTSDHAVTVVAALAHATHAAHEAGVIHRDIKPANVFLDGDGRPKLGDFGLAKVADDGAGPTHTGAAVGTPSYMAPEQAIGSPVTIAADVYSLGAVLYECLTGRPPFRGASVIDTFDQLRHRDPVSVRQLQPSVRRDLETVCLKCLRKDPSGRYGSAAELAEDLERFQAGRPVQARPIGAAERGWMAAKRRPVVTALAAAVVVLLFVGAIGGIVTARKQAALRTEADAAAEKERDRRRALRQALDETTSVAMAELIHSGRPASDHRKFFERVIAQYERLAKEDTADPTAQVDLATAWAHIASMLDSLGRADAAGKAFETAERLTIALTETDPTYRPLAARVAHHYAEALERRQRHVDCEAAARRAFALYDFLAADGDSMATCLAVNGRLIAGRAAVKQGHADKARALVAVGEKMLAPLPLINCSPAEREATARAVGNLASVYQLLGERDLSRAATARAAALIAPLADTPIHRRQSIESLAHLTSNLALSENEDRAYDRAEVTFQKAIDYYRELLRRTPAKLNVRQHFARALVDRGTALERLNRFNDALVVQRESCDIFLGLIEDLPDDADAHFHAGDACNRLEIVLRGLRRFNDARTINDRAIALFKRTIELDPERLNVSACLGGALVNRSSLERVALSPEAALPWLDRAEAVLSTAQTHRPTATSADFLRNVYLNRAQILHSLNRFDDARANWDRGLAINADPRDEPSIRVERALTDVARGLVVEGAAVAKEILAARPNNRTRYDAARVLAAAASHRPILTDSPAWAKTAADTVVSLHAAGYFKNAKNRKDFAQSTTFTNLRKRAEIEALFDD